MGVVAEKLLYSSNGWSLEPVAGNVFINGDALWGDESDMTQVFENLEFCSKGETLEFDDYRKMLLYL